MVRRGMSLEEKRTALLRVFVESEDFLNGKEMEKRGAKTGIPSMAVKDVAQTLLDDNLLFMDKVGSSNYYWSFKSAASQRKRQREEDLEAEVSEKKKQKTLLEAAQAELDESRAESETRTEGLAEYEALQAEIVTLNARLARYAESDPERLAELRAALATASEAANRWTDNIFQARSHCQKKFNMEPAMFNKYFEIAADFDYIE